MAAKGSLKENTQNRLKEPKRYNVIMHNDDFTSMEFVVSILVDIFHKDINTAQTLMMQVHKSGKSAIGTYSYDIAATRVDAAMHRARAEGFPFRMTIEEA